MGKAALFIGTKTKSLLAVPVDQNTAGNTPRLSRYNTEQMKGMSDRFTSKFPYKNSDCC